MSETLKSVGLDVGTTSTQMILSELTVENRAGSFSVPEMTISQRKILYKSKVHFTPLLDESHVDAAALREIIAKEYAAAHIRREEVDTGAIIITGETSRKENARAVLQELSGFAGDFVVATAGPDLESVLAAKGAGAVSFSYSSGENVLHIDIGGGTSNFAWIRNGEIEQTGCLNVGGRLLKFDDSGVVTYVSPVLQGICSLKAGGRAAKKDVEAVAEILTQALEMAAGLREKTDLLQKLTTEGTSMSLPPEEKVISFSGGVADCIDREVNWLAYGDMGPILGQRIRDSRLCRGKYRLGDETIRATVIGAGSHTTQLSGSTVFCRGVKLPMKNVPVAVFSEQQQAREDFPELLKRAIAARDEKVMVALPGYAGAGYTQVRNLARTLAAVIPEGEVMVCLEQDMAKALGQALALILPEKVPILCLDRIRLTQESYLDVGTPVGPAMPVVIKTLVLSR